ncbi:MAG: aminoacyl-tRNA hydrolase [Acutalibacteraceae bacterium]
MFFKKSTLLAEGETYIVVGLGNPGSEYEHTRHNAGFIALDTLAEKYNIKVDRLKFKSLCGMGTIESKRVLLMKPSTYMNLSGQAVMEAMAFYKTPPERTIILSDDISLDTGKLRIRRKGSDGGHNGIKNIIYLSGSDQFPRIKIGVGAKPAQWNLADWVLSHFSEQEMKNVEQACACASDAVPLILQGNIDKAMNKFNS